VSFELILPFLRPIEGLIKDPEISEIMVNGSGRIFFERHGRIEPACGVSIPEKTLQVAVQNIARRLGDEISEENPLLDSRLPDGSRVAAVMPPCSIGGTTLTIRKFHTKLYTAEELVRCGSLPAPVMEELRRAIHDRKNLVISGGTSTGKTTLLNALATMITGEDRIDLIEDTAEIQLEHENLVSLEARREHPGQPADRIILGEVRGGEAFDLLQDLNTGHSGTLCTIHANSAQQAINRFTSCVLQSGVELPYHAIRSSIGDSLDLLLHIERHHGKRRIAELVEVKRFDPTNDIFEFRTLYEIDSNMETRSWTSKQPQTMSARTSSPMTV
jgi:pilus assembly protein CpaF